TGIEEYIKDMQQDRVNGGGPELHALTALFDVHVVIFKDTGDVVHRDEGAGSAGRAVAKPTLKDDEITALRSDELNLIEGKQVTDTQPYIYFRRLSRAQ